ncbi:MAG TPA: proline racemase family protein [Anaerolineae bacterium]|nr:proline racemase family protein [Anaerolineae bacterium]
MATVMKNWTPPDDWLKITTVDAHTEGEPFRVITGGFPDLPGATILEKRRYAKERLDHLRTALMWEPRGHADMYGCIVTPPVTPGADLGILFMHNEGFSTMCGHGIIGIATVALEIGMLPATEPETTLKIDTPAGLVTAHAIMANRRVRRVRFQNVPSFVVALDETVEVPGLGQVRYDLAFGGAFYAYVQAEEIGLSCTPEDYRPLIEKGMAIKRAVMESRSIPHPFEADLSFLYGTIFIGRALTENGHSRNVCVFAEGEVDRSPTGTGVSGRLAIHYARGEIDLNQPIIIESIIGSRFSGRVVETTTFGPYPAIIPEVEGTAHITGRHEFLIDPDDPLQEGFLLR